MKDEIKEILDNLKYTAKKHTIQVLENGGKIESCPQEIATEMRLNSYSANILLDYITNLQEENKRLLKTQEMYEKKCNNIHQYITQNCEIIRHENYDEVGKVNGGHILHLLAENNISTKNLYKYTSEKGFILVGDKDVKDKR